MMTSLRRSTYDSDCVNGLRRDLARSLARAGNVFMCVYVVYTHFEMERFYYYDITRNPQALAFSTDCEKIIARTELQN